MGRYHPIFRQLQPSGSVSLEKTDFSVEKCEKGFVGERYIFYGDLFFFFSLESTPAFKTQYLQENSQLGTVTSQPWLLGTWMCIMDCVFRIPPPTPTKLTLARQSPYVSFYSLGLHLFCIVIRTVKEPKRIKSPVGPADGQLTVFTQHPIG